jgi:hypothetical protein
MKQIFAIWRVGNILGWKKEAFVSENPEQNIYPPKESPDEDYLWIYVGM